VQVRIGKNDQTGAKPVRTVITALSVTVILAVTVSAEPSPYRGLEGRAIKALSEAEIGDLRSGAGMAMALAAELNGHPGPRHVLDLAAPLGLSAGQIAAVQSLFDTMREEASALGDAIVAGEAELEHGFRSASLDDERLTALVQRIADLRGELRAVHLRRHLSTRALLDEHQLARYDRLRGYDGDRSHGHGHHRRH